MNRPTREARRAEPAARRPLSHCLIPMTMLTSIRGVALPLVAASALLTGCAAPSAPPLYQWTGYQREVYDYLKGEKGPQEQIDALEKALQQIRADGKRPPPGFQAQLGVLYAGAGDDERAMQAFEAEKESFPESAPYMDFLMKKPKPHAAKP